MRMCGGLGYPGPDRLHNLKEAERILLNGDLTFCSTFNSNELGPARIAHRQPLRYEPLDELTRGGHPRVEPSTNRDCLACRGELRRLALRQREFEDLGRCPNRRLGFHRRLGLA